MIKLIKTIPFFYLCALVFIYGSISISSKPYLQIILWGVYIIFNLYFYLIERINPAIPAFIPVLICITGGITSPVMPIIFLALPFVLTYLEKHYISYSILALLTLLMTGKFSRPDDFILFAVFILSVAAVYLFSRKDLIKRIFRGKADMLYKNVKEETKKDAVDDPFMPLKNYIERMRIWDKNFPVSIRLVQLTGDKAELFGTAFSFSPLGLLMLAKNNRQDIACATILEEKEYLPMMPEFNKRVYFPINLFDYNSKTIEPEFVIVIDTNFEGDKQLLIEKFSTIKRDIIELIKIGETFKHIYLERKRKEKLYNGAKLILDSFERDKLFRATAWSIMNIVPQATALLFTETKAGQNIGHIYNKTTEKGTIPSIEDINLVSSGDINDKQSIQSLMIDGKLGKNTEIKDIRKRKENQNFLFTDPEFSTLNNYTQMYALLLSHKDSAKGTLSYFLEDDSDVPSYLKTDVSLIAQAQTAALNNIGMYERVEELSNADGLTGLYNRRFFQENIERMASESARSKRTLSLIMLDIDFFKKVNDTYGHKAGDDVIKFLARTLRNNTRKVDIVARYGGEEFVILMPDTTKDGAYSVAEKIREIIRNALVITDEHQIKITSSFGISSFPDTAQSFDDLIKTADEALYFSKQNGRNRVTIFSGGKSEKADHNAR